MVPTLPPGDRTGRRTVVIVLAALLVLAPLGIWINGAVKEQSPSPTPSRTPSLVPVPERPQGVVRIEDAIGDLVDRKDRRVTGHEGVDIAAVRLSSNGKRFTATFIMAGPIPKDSGPGTADEDAGKDSLRWVLDTWMPGTFGSTGGLYSFDADLIGTAWQVTMVTWEPISHVLLPGRFEVRGRRLTWQVKLDKVPALAKPFEWSASVEWGYRSPPDTIGYSAGEDNLPDDRNARASFPSGIRVRHNGRPNSSQASNARSLADQFLPHYIRTYRRTIGSYLSRDLTALSLRELWIWNAGGVRGL